MSPEAGVFMIHAYLDTLLPLFFLLGTQRIACYSALNRDLLTGLFRIRPAWRMGVLSP